MIQSNYACQMNSIQCEQFEFQRLASLIHLVIDLTIGYDQSDKSTIKQCTCTVVYVLAGLYNYIYTSFTHEIRIP